MGEEPAGEPDQRTPARIKKRLASALLDIARTGRTNDERLIRIIRAQKINKVVGGAAVMPWEVDELPEEWLDLFTGMVDELPEVSRMVKEQESAREAFLKKNEYRKYTQNR